MFTALTHERKHYSTTFMMTEIKNSKNFRCTQLVFCGGKTLPLTAGDTSQIATDITDLTQCKLQKRSTKMHYAAEIVNASMLSNNKSVAWGYETGLIAAPPRRKSSNQVQTVQPLVFGMPVFTLISWAVVPCSFVFNCDSMPSGIV